jgi:hypothetical protein
MELDLGVYLFSFETLIIPCLAEARYFFEYRLNKPPNTCTSITPLINKKQHKFHLRIKLGLTMSYHGTSNGAVEPVCGFERVSPSEGLGRRAPLFGRRRMEVWLTSAIDSKTKVGLAELFSDGKKESGAFNWMA